jgi:hypothetical protein
MLYPVREILLAEVNTRYVISPVEPVNGSEILEPIVLGQNEDDSVVSVAAAWVNLRREF